MSKISVTTIAGLTSGGDANKVIIESGDTLQVDSNATVGGTLGVTGDATFDTNTLKVDSSNNRVGIGTASPASRIHIGDSSNSGEEAIQFSNDAVQGFIGIEGSSGNRFLGSAVNNMFIGTTAADGLELATNNNVRMKIDTNGVITTPNVPAFSVYASPTYNGTFRSFGNIHRNNGNHYDNSNGKFTAPVAGHYFFSCTLWPTSGNIDTTNSYLVFYINNSEHLGGHVGEEYHAITISAMIYLSANDTVDVRKNGSWTLQGSTPRNNFHGFLIG